MSHDSKGSGLLVGGGRRGTYRKPSRFKHHPLKTGMPDCLMTDRKVLRELIPDFDPKLEFEYSERELALLAEKILDADPKPPTEAPTILFMDHLRARQKREVYGSRGVVEPHIAKGLYWRTHPNGRRYRSKKQRRDRKESFYA